MRREGRAAEFDDQKIESNISLLQGNNGNRKALTRNQSCYALRKCRYFPAVILSQQRRFLLILLCEMDAASRSDAGVSPS
jgi:hypothetical protein